VSALLGAWYIDNAVIGSQLAIYFRGTGLPDQWRRHEIKLNIYIQYAAHINDEASNNLQDALIDRFRRIAFDDAKDEATVRCLASGGGSSY
jgi:hypothetical protein